MDRYDEVRRDAERARTAAQIALDLAARRAKEISGLLDELRTRQGGDQWHEPGAEGRVSDQSGALQLARDEEHRGRERAARAHDRAARQHDRLAALHEQQDDASAVREHAAGVRDRHAAEQDGGAPKRDS